MPQTGFRVLYIRCDRKKGWKHTAAAYFYTSQVLTDRFALTDDAGTPCDTAPQLYCNGTFKGIVNHLDYIQAMGFDAIWISPVVTNLEGNSAGEGDAYHGYWTQDITTINKHFGTSDDLKALSKALHSRGMYLMLDVVINHFASFGLPNDTTISAYGTFNAPDLFHPQCFISDYNNQTNVEQCWLGDTTVALADLNTESQTVIDGWNKWITGMVSEYSLDGLRIDTLKHVRKPFWPAFQQAAGVYAVGEVLINDTSYASDYSSKLNLYPISCTLRLTSFRFYRWSSGLSGLLRLDTGLVSYLYHKVCRQIE